MHGPWWGRRRRACRGRPWGEHGSRAFSPWTRSTISERPVPSLPYRAIRVVWAPEDDTRPPGRVAGESKALREEHRVSVTQGGRRRAPRGARRAPAASPVSAARFECGKCRCGRPARSPLVAGPARDDLRRVAEIGSTVIAVDTNLPVHAHRRESRRRPGSRDPCHT